MNGSAVRFGGPAAGPVTTPPVSGYPSGRVTSYAYTDGTSSAGGYQGAVPPAELPYQETTQGGAVTTTLYYADGDVAQVTTPDGQRTVYAYDGLGRKVSQTVYSTSYPGGLVTTYAYDANGNLVTQTGPPVTDRVTGAVHTAQVTTVYDAGGDMTSRTTADLTGGDAARTVGYARNGLDQVTSVTDAAGAVTKYTYDAYGNKASQTDPDGNVTQYAYDGDGHLLTTTLQNYTGSPPGSQSAAPLVEESRSYDPAGRLAEVVDAMGRQTWYSYTDNGLVSQVTQVSPGGSSSFTTAAYSYDGAGDVTQKWAGNGETETTYAYDAAGRVTRQALDPSGLNRVTSIAYTPDDQPATVTRTGPDGVTQVTSYTYDPAGNVLSQTLADPGAGGPAAWFALSQTSGTAVSDQAPGGQPATASGVTWDGSEAGFSGSAGSQIATAGRAADTAGSFTVTAWANVEGSTGASQAVLSQAAGTAAGFTLQYNPGTGNWEFTRPLADTASPPLATAGSGANATTATGVWTFLAGVYDANTGTMTLYVNGTAAGTAADVTPVAAHGAFTIGSAKNGGAQGNWFDGQIAEVQVYPRPLPAGEVGQLYGSSGDITTGTLTTTWTRGQRGLPTSVTSPDGQVTNYSYDSAGQLAVTTGPTVTTQTYGNAPVTARPVTTTGYDTFGETAETEDADGNVTVYGYDADGRPVSKTLPPYTPPGGSTAVTAVDTTAYDPDGLVTSTTDGLGNTTKYAYDQLGDQVSVTAPDGSVTATAYDADGEPLSVTGPTGAVTEATYDYLGRKVTATQVERDTASGTAVYTTGYTYNDTSGGGWLSQQASPDGVTTSYGYDTAGEVTSVTDGAGNTTSYSYDSLGRKTKVTYPDGTATTVGYDAAGNVTSTANLDSSGTVLAATSATFDGEGDQLSATDAAGNTTAFTYDPAGLVTQEVQPVSAASAITTSFGYDANGSRTLYTDPNGNAWQYTYNSWGLQESQVEPATAQYSSAADSTFTTAYNAGGQPVTVTEPGGVTVTDSYNSVGELTGQAGTGADAATPARSFGYDAAGNLTSAATTSTAPSGSPSNATSESFTYNDRGLVTAASGSAGSTSYAYNGDGQAVSVADAAGTTAYAYDSAGRLATLADPATGTTLTYSYNSSSQVAGISYGSGGDTQSFGYDSQHRLVSDTLATASGTTVASTGYGYNANGQVTSQATAGLAGPASNTYTYDQAGRLTSWNNGTATVSYGYDNNGNLTQNGTATYTYDARDELTGNGTASYTYTARGTPSAEPSPSGTVAVTFDAYGDQASAGTNMYAYDALGRLAAVTPTSGGGNQFSYVGSTGTIASDGTSAYTWDPSGTTLVAAGAPGGGTGGSLTLTDAHGNVTGQFTAAATTLTGSQAYNPWGTVTATTGTLAGQLGYQSAWADPATGKNLMGARWYSPGAGSFTSADTVPQSPLPDPAAGNPYAYAAGNPLGNVDPSGHWATPTSYDPLAPLQQAGEDLYQGIEDFVVGAASSGATATSASTGTGIFTATNFGLGGMFGILSVLLSGDSAPAPAPAASVAPASVVSPLLPSPAYRAGAARAAGPKNSSRPREIIVSDAFNSYSNGSVPGPSSHGPAPHGQGPVNGPHVSGYTPPAPRWRQQHRQRASSPHLPPAQNEAGILQQVIQQIRQLAAAGTGNGGNGGNGGGVPAPPAAGGACPPPFDPLSFLLNLLGPGNGQNRQPSSGGQSFTAGTRVLLPNGKTVPISHLKPGDKVLAYNEKTGKDQPETVTAVLLHHDTNLYNLKIKTSSGTEVIHTTSSHLFWDPY
ncbi:MAG TPA: LamG-like jellyroll fold domain-containing protein, partial [Trebonia sp.]|nr:LamG-like jellyroll fold domain-containing protein [Trebonia sp.]